MKHFAIQLQSYPFVRLLAALIGGILISYFGFLPRVAGWLSALLLLACWLMFAILHHRFVIRKIYTGVFVLLSFVLLGYGLEEIFKQEREAEFQEIVTGYFFTKVIDIPVEKKQKVRCLLEMYQMDSLDASLFHRMGKIQAYFEPDTHARSLIPGNWLMMQLNPIRIRSDGNPDSFDYARFMEQKEVWYQCQISSGNWSLLTDEYAGLPPPGFMDRITSIRYLIIKNLHTSGLDPPVQAFVGALILGFKDELDAELKANFTSIGVVHVLAVSGLHVAIIYVVLEKLFYLLIFLPFGKWLRFILILLFLWFYVFLAGFSPSVLRAAFMFSLVLIARNIRKDSSMYNIMAASAFIILVLNPEALFDLGFLFSYLAVLGIVMLQPWMLEVVNLPYSWMNKLWASISLSLTAQLLVTPISIHYFHSFPVWFIPANLIIVPLVVAYTYPAALVMIIPQHGWIYELLCKVLNWGYILTAQLAGFFDDLPYSRLGQLRLDVLQVLVLYLLIILILFFLMKKNPGVVSWILVVTIVYLGYSSYRYMDFGKQQKLVVFNVSGGWMLASLTGHTAEIVLSVSDTTLIEKKAMNYLINQGIKSFSVHALTDSTDVQGKSFEKIGNYLIWKDQVFFLKFLKKKNRKPALFSKVDWILSDYPMKDTSGMYHQVCRYASGAISVQPPGKIHCLSDQGAMILTE